MLNDSCHGSVASKINNKLFIASFSIVFPLPSSLPSGHE